MTEQSTQHPDQNSAPVPPAGEVAELARWLRELGAKRGGVFDVSTFCANLDRAAELLERQQPQPDFRALCAKVIQYNEGQGKYNFSHLDPLDREDAAFDAWQEIRSEIKHALAQPVPPGPTDFRALCAELVDDLEDWITYVEAGIDYGDALDIEESRNLIDRTLAVLARWGNTTPQPVPVSERMPGPEDCDAEGYCWWFDTDSWIRISPNSGFAWGKITHWLPAHALPLPAGAQP